MGDELNLFFIHNVIGNKPTAFEKNNLPLEIRYAYNEAINMSTKVENTTSSQHDAKLPVSRLLPSDEEITNAANNHQLGGYVWQAEKRKSFELGAKWARMVMSAELSEGNNG